jgi:hypothetical protein
VSDAVPSDGPVTMAGGMATARLLIGRAGAALGVRVARVLYGRWRLLPPSDRARVASLVARAKDAALELRGASDRERADAELRTANETLAAALVESAEADPEVDEDEVRQLRADLRRELERLAGGATSRPG